MDLSVRQNTALARLRELIAVGEALQDQDQSSGQWDEWVEETKEILGLLDPASGLLFHMDVIQLESNPKRLSRLLGKLRGLYVRFGGHELHANSPSKPTEHDPRTVFVVHGRDIKNRDAMFEFLQAIGLRPLGWEEAVRLTGRATPYTGEVVERGIASAQAVVVLLTGDDEARLVPQYQRSQDPASEIKLTRQPRPNVLFEAGMAMAAATRDRTILVEIGSLRGLTDTDGLNVVRFDGTREKREQLLERLRTAGCAVDANGGWDTAGQFVLTNGTAPDQEETATRIPNLVLGQPGSMMLSANVGGAWLNLVVQAPIPVVERRPHSAANAEFVRLICETFKVEQSQVDISSSDTGVLVNCPRGYDNRLWQVRIVQMQVGIAQAIVQVCTQSPVHVAWILRQFARSLALATSPAAQRFMQFSPSTHAWASLSNWATDGITTEGLFELRRLSSGDGFVVREQVVDFSLRARPSTEDAWGLAKRLAEAVLLGAGVVEFEDALTLVTPQMCEAVLSS